MKDLSKSALCYVLKKQVPKIGWNQFRWRILNLVLEIRIQLNSSFFAAFHRQEEAVCPAGNEITNFFFLLLLDLVRFPARKKRDAT